MEDHQYVNLVTETNNKVLEKLMEAMAKQQEKMTLLMASLANNNIGGGTTTTGQQLTEERNVSSASARSIWEEWRSVGPTQKIPINACSGTRIC